MTIAGASGKKSRKRRRGQLSGRNTPTSDLPPDAESHAQSTNCCYGGSGGILLKRTPLFVLHSALRSGRWAAVEWEPLKGWRTGFRREREKRQRERRERERERVVGQFATALLDSHGCALARL
ncbi:hypothetical protein HPP92_020132 [Vanilla planifolia]|uniref:Uncharacterized protein n=1 Tax=Vanilla planifolia TaxID=51239 RepID=A0A835UJT5_VANPL|nr:hypothetical protein HPP92_020132 [Vanilla planifolia]